MGDVKDCSHGYPKELCPICTAIGAEEKPKGISMLPVKLPLRTEFDFDSQVTRIFDACGDEPAFDDVVAACNSIAQKDATIAALQSDVVNRDNAIAAMRSTRDEMQDNLRRADEQLAERDATIAELRKELSGLSADYKNMVKQSDAFEIERNSLTSALESANNTIAELRAVAERERVMRRDAEAAATSANVGSDLWKEKCDQLTSALDEASRDSESYRHGMAQAQRDAASYMQQRDAAQAEAARLREDAGRYVWLRDGYDTGWFIGRYPDRFDDVELDWSDTAAVDAAIDAAISLSSKERGDG